MEVIYVFRQLMQKFREKRRDLRMIFIDIIKDMYDGAITSVRTTNRETCAFSIIVGLHQGSTLSPYVFVVIMDELTGHLQEEAPWCMQFVDDKVLIDKTRAGIHRKLELWRKSLEFKGYEISRTKKCMHCSLVIIEI
jgi:hypothetical protein